MASAYGGRRNGVAQERRPPGLSLDRPEAQERVPAPCADLHAETDMIPNILRRQWHSALLALAALTVLGSLGCRNTESDMAAAGTGPTPTGPTGPARHADLAEVSGPFVHDRLAVYLLIAADDPAARPPAGARDYITLAEALESGEAVVHETGDVNRL